MDAKKSWSVGFEFVDIEIIDHNESEKEKSTKKFGCDQCNMFFCNQEKLEQHQKEHEAESVKCRYCNKTLSMTEESKESYTNRKCETCEYRCSQCPQRFLRHSSLLNHEKNHILPRKRKTPLASKKCINGLKTPRNSEISKLLKKRKQEKPIEESDEEEDSITPRIGLKKKQKYRSESTDFDNSAANYNDRVIPNNSKEIKRLPFRASKSLGEEKLGAKKKKSSLASNNVSPAISSPLDNSVNYKPFSCHVCGDTFATDHDLLEHIRSHGEVAKSFRCKHCGDEFEDIYKMQFHLAVCPFAEDELDSSIKKPSIPHKTKTIPSPSATPRKRGRPRKVTVDVNTSTSEDEPEESVRKTKAAQTFMTLPKRIGRKRTYKPVLNESGSGIDQEESDSDNSENCDDPRLDEDYIPTRTKDLMDGGEDSKKVHACPFPRCAFKFTREKALLCHMRNHTDDFDEALKCHKCDTPFDDLQSLRTHIDECREVREETEETDDDFIESSEDPENDDENDTPFHKFQKSKGTLCRVCRRAYSSTAKLKSHKCQGANPLSKKFPCRICGEELVTQRSLEDHFKTVHPTDRVYQCPKCLLQFDDLMKANTHVLTHVRSYYECSVCYERMASKKPLMKHFAEKHPGADKSTCGICNKKYSDPSALAKHRHVHTGERPYLCPICYMTFTLKNSQVVHLRRHTNYRPYKCKLCPKRFFNAGDLKKHNRAHTGETPYQCNICKVKFTLKETLNNHAKTHWKTRPHKCMYCPKSFNSKTLLKYHVVVHWGVKPFQCPLCTDSFYHLGLVRTHLKKFHIDQFAKKHVCQICGKDQRNALQLLEHLMLHRNGLNKKKIDINALLNVKTPQPEAGVRNRGRPPRKLQVQTSVSVATSRKTASRKHSVAVAEPSVTIRKRGRPRKLPVQTAVSTEAREPNSPEQQEENEVVIKDSLPSKSDEEFKEEIKEESAKDNGVYEVAEKDDGVYEVTEKDNGVYEVAAFQPAVKEEFSCTMCEAIFDSFETLVNHVYIHI